MRLGMVMFGLATIYGVGSCSGQEEWSYRSFVGLGLNSEASLRENLAVLVEPWRTESKLFDFAWFGRLRSNGANVALGETEGRISMISVSLDGHHSSETIEHLFSLESAEALGGRCPVGFLHDHLNCHATYYGCVASPPICPVEVLRYSRGSQDPDSAEYVDVVWRKNPTFLPTEYLEPDVFGAEPDENNAQ